MEQTLTEFAAAPRCRTFLVSGFGVLALCLAVAGISCYLPASRAASIDPLSALRVD